MSSQLSRSEIAKNTSRAVVRLVAYIILYVVAAVLVQWLFTGVFPLFGLMVIDYLVYPQILLALAMGYLIVGAVGVFIYWSTRLRYDHSTAAAIKNLVKIIGLGGLAASLAGGVAGGGAGVALGGFIGIVIGFASQQVLGQAIAGFFLLISRPFKIGDTVVIGGDEGVVEEISTLFTTVSKTDGSKTLIPNNSIIGGKIHIKHVKQA